MLGGGTSGSRRISREVSSQAANQRVIEGLALGMLHSGTGTSADAASGCVIRSKAGNRNRIVSPLESGRVRTCMRAEPSVGRPDRSTSNLRHLSRAWFPGAADCAETAALHPPHEILGRLTDLPNRL